MLKEILSIPQYVHILAMAKSIVLLFFMYPASWYLYICIDQLFIGFVWFLLPCNCTVQTLRCLRISFWKHYPALKSENFSFVAYDELHFCYLFRSSNLLLCLFSKCFLFSTFKGTVSRVVNNGKNIRLLRP
jgi:hypothetical protein